MQIALVHLLRSTVTGGRIQRGLSSNQAFSLTGQGAEVQGQGAMTCSESLSLGYTGTHMCGRGWWYQPRER